MIAEFYVVDRGLRHRLPGFSSLDRPVFLTQGLRRFRCQWSRCGSCPTGPDSRGAGLVRSELIPIGHVSYLVDRGLRHRLPGFSSLDRPVVLTQGLRRFRCQWSHCGSCPTGPDSRGAGFTTYTCIRCTAGWGYRVGMAIKTSIETHDIFVFICFALNTL